MQDEPTPIELTKAVADFLRNDITPLISGHQAFKLRVAINILDLVTRQLTREAGSDAAEVERLRSLLGEDGTVMELNRALAERITKGEVDLATPGLADHLWATTMDKLAVEPTGPRRARPDDRLREAIQGLSARAVWIASSQELRAMASERTCLLPHPFRRPLLRERLRALDIILRGHHRLDRRILALLLDRLFQRDGEPLLDRLLRGADRHRPTRGSGRAKVAFSEAMMRSQASAISKPPPIATPFTAAMIGLSQSKREVRPAKPPLSQPRLPPAACHFRSLPAQNALSPAPVTIAIHCSGSPEKSSNTFCSSKCASVCSAL